MSVAAFATMDAVLIRAARADDAAALAAMHLATWQVAYRGIVPDAFLDGLDLEAWTQHRRARFDQDRETIVAVEGDAVLGFVATCPARDDPDPAVGELKAMYVAPAAWGSGVGRALMTAALDALGGYREATLWVLRDNARARRFYAAAGWRPDGAEDDFEVGGFAIPEVRYRRALP